MKKPLTIEIHGTGTYNRGAELMTIAIVERMRKNFPGVRLVVSPLFGDFDARARYGLLTTWEFPGRGRSKISSVVIRYASEGLRSILGVLDPQEIDLILDASGFAFSDQWGSGPANALLEKSNDSCRSGKPLIMLPQAFGPFDEPQVAAASKRLFDRTALIFARDTHSHKELTSLGVTFPKLQRFPDFTVGVHPVLSADIDLPAHFTAIVPNIRMTDKGDSAAYLDFLNRTIQHLQDREMNPVFVLHDAVEDRKVVEELQNRGHSIPVMESHDPRILKGILGRATLVVGSRFHALVSSLSQGVPCIGAGWSHKYPELFSDFNCPDLLVNDLSNDQHLQEAICKLADENSRAIYQSSIWNAANHLKELNETMWQEVENLIRTLI